MAALPYMQLFVADYLADTKHLRGIEHGIYLLLMMHYWQTGKPLPIDDDRLALISCVTVKEFKKAKPVISDFFIEVEEKWYHKRIEADLSLIEQKSNKARASAMESVKKRLSERSANAHRTLSERSATNEEVAQRTLTYTETEAQAFTKAQTKTKKGKIDFHPDFLEIFEYWQNVMNTQSSYPIEARISKIKKALKNYSVEYLKDAIDGCKLSDWQMTHKRNDITHIFQNEIEIERFNKIKNEPHEIKIKSTTEDLDKIIEEEKRQQQNKEIKNVNESGYGKNF